MLNLAILFNLLMKATLYLAFAVLLLKCNGSSSSNFKLHIDPKNKKVRKNDTVKLRLINKKNIPVESVRFLLNEKSIEENHVIGNEPLGLFPLQMTVEHEGKTTAVKSTISIFADAPPKLYSYKILNEYPHDKTAYTQGLEFDGDILYESTGLNGKSSLRKVDYKTGEILINIPLDQKYFGEGITVVNDKIIQLTWKVGLGFVYNKDSLRVEKSFDFNKSKEGWGLCNDGKQLYKSDGTNKIWILNPETQEEMSFIQVMTDKTALNKLNELEWVDGKIYANTYQSNKEVVLIINPESGKVEGVIDFSGLKERVKQHPELNVLNGIAYHKGRKTLFVTGKNWNKLFEVKIFEKN